MKHDEKVLMLAALLLAYGGVANGVPVTETSTSPVAIFNSGTATFSFAPLVSADELISISDGHIFSPEGATFTLDVDYLIGAPERILTGNVGQVSTFDFSSLAPLPFTSGTINGITFGFSGSFGSLQIPSGTRFTFDAAPAVGPSVPEPSSLALLAAGSAAGLLNWRRRRAHLVQDATSE